MCLANVRFFKDINHQSLINFQFSSEVTPTVFLGHNVVVIPLELVVNQNDAFVGQQDGSVAALAQNDVQIVPDPFELRRRGGCGF